MNSCVCTHGHAKFSDLDSGWASFSHHPSRDCCEGARAFGSLAQSSPVGAVWRDVWSLGVAVKTMAEQWFDEDCSSDLAVRRLRSLKDIVSCVVRWLAPRTKRGRCRNVLPFFQVLVLLQSVTAMYAVFSGRKRTCDFLWTRYLPEALQARLLRGARFGVNQHLTIILINKPII